MLCSFLGDFPTSEFSMPTFRKTLLHFYRSFKRRMEMEQTDGSETSGNHPKETIQRVRLFIISNTRRVWKAVGFLLGYSPTSVV
jgi:hypothetical protein